MEKLSFRAYARHRGVTLRAVQKAIESNRISTVLDERGRPKIDPEVADIQWAKNTRPDQQERGSLKDFEKTQADLAGLSVSTVAKSMYSDKNATSQLSSEKAETEVIRRQLIELQLAQKLGELVRVSDIERAMAQKIKTAHEKLNTLADRLAPILAAESDVKEVDRILRAEIRHAMSQIAQEAPPITQ